MLNVYGPDMIHAMPDVESSKTSPSYNAKQSLLLLLPTR